MSTDTLSTAAGPYDCAGWDYPPDCAHCQRQMRQFWLDPYDNSPGSKGFCSPDCLEFAPDYRSGPLDALFNLRDYND